MSDQSAGLRLRRVRHPAVKPGEAFRVVCRGFEVGSIGLQQGAAQRRFWSWGLDTVGQLGFPTHGEAADRDDTMARFKAAWTLFAADQARLDRFFEAKAAIEERAARWGRGSSDADEEPQTDAT